MTHNRNFAYLFSLTPAIMVIVGNIAAGYFSILNIVYSLVVLGVLDWLLPSNKSNESGNADDHFPELILWLHIPMQLVCIISLMHGAYTESLSGTALIAAALSTGINTGSGAIVVAHELIHRKNKLQNFLGRWLLFTAGNFYFFVEHLKVHHKWVGTKKDSATARKNQSLYAFFLSSTLGQLNSALTLENTRLKHDSFLKKVIGNYVIRQFILHAIFDTLVVLSLGWIVLGAFVLQCIVANFLLEYVNYIEHYGLSRDEKERVTEFHSWQSDKVISRFVLVDLSRHADHHYYASKPYHTLKSYENSPELPSGYAGLFFVAAVPPFWFKLMNPRLPTT